MLKVLPNTLKPNIIISFAAKMCIRDRREEALKWLKIAKAEGRDSEWMAQAQKELEKPKGFKLFKGK